jgi:hypothetical protein
VLVHRTPALTPKVINQMGKTSLNPALTGILAGTKTLKGKYRYRTERRISPQGSEPEEGDEVWQADVVSNRIR